MKLHRLPIVGYLFLLSIGYGAEPDLIGLLKKAESGDPKAQVELGDRYLKGQGFPPSISEGVSWFRRAAENGYAEGQAALALMYEEGIGVSQDMDEAVRWYRKAADQGSAHALYTLGVIYADGKGVPRNPKEAARLFLQVAERSPGAVLRLITMFENGDGVSQDLVAAYVWSNVAVALRLSSAKPALLRIGGKLTQEQLKEGDRRWPLLAEKMTKEGITVGTPPPKRSMNSPAYITSADAVKKQPEKRPNQPPEPTPGTVTPGAPLSSSK